VAAFVFRGKILVSKQAILDSVVSWTKCVFSTYDGSNHWKNVCGHAPPDRPSYTFNVFILIFISGQGVIITTIFEWNNFLNLTKKIILRFVIKVSLNCVSYFMLRFECGTILHLTIVSILSYLTNSISHLFVPTLSFPFFSSLLFFSLLFSSLLLSHCTALYGIAGVLGHPV
jgi:hypothetical protein